MLATFSMLGSFKCQISMDFENKYYDSELDYMIGPRINSVAVVSVVILAVIAVGQQYSPSLWAGLPLRNRGCVYTVPDHF